MIEGYRVNPSDSKCEQNNMNSCVPADDASAFTLSYLSLIESSLKILWTEAGVPLFRPECVTDDECQKLRSELHDLFTGQPAERALQSTRAVKSSLIQCVGFGIAKQLDSMVKLGFLYGERLVLWDVMLNLLNHRSFIIDQKLCIGETACNLLLLRSLAKAGAVVILPHPVVWCDLARYVADELKARGNSSIPDYGLSMALATFEDGFTLHPFTVVKNQQPGALEDLSSLQGEFYSRENYVFQHAISSLLADESFSFLDRISAADFYSVASKYPQLHHEMRKHLALLTSGLTKTQVEQTLIESRRELHEQIEKRNGAFRLHALDSTLATAMAMTSTLTVLGGLPEDTGAMLTLAAGAGLTPTLCEAGRKWLSPPDGPVLVQAFSEMRQSESAQAINLQKPKTDTANFGTANPEVQRHKDLFMSEDWVEQRHQYLQRLPLAMARAVLRSLTTEELHSNVNNRQLQNDYIGDYLSEVYEIDEESFWSHIQASLQHEDGLLIYDGDRHVEIMCSETIPNKVWNQLLKSFESFSHRADSLAWSAYERQIMSEIVNAQLTRFADSNRVASFGRWFRGLPTKSAAWVVEGIQEVNAGIIPNWLPES
jgi:hypothetical protein